MCFKNARSCRRTPRPRTVHASTQVSNATSITMPCSSCGGSGHNARTCVGSKKKAQKAGTKRRSCEDAVVASMLRADKKAKKSGRRDFVWCPEGTVPYRDESGDVYFEAAPRRVQCECGGSHLECGTAAGAKSYRSHMGSTRHMKYQFPELF